MKSLIIALILFKKNVNSVATNDWATGNNSDSIVQAVGTSVKLSSTLAIEMGKIQLKYICTRGN